MYRRHSGGDRRRFQRLSLNISVFYKIDQPPEVRIAVGDKEIEATMLDLSQGGMAFLTDYNIPLWSRLFIKFILGKMGPAGVLEVSRPLEIIGEVVSNSLSEEDEYRLGICFKQVGEEDKKEIAGYIGARL